MDYRIKMEPISEKGQEKLSDDLRNGIECKGFTLIANLGDKTQVVIQGMSTHDLAEAFAGEAKFMAAAHVGKAIQESREIEAKPFSPLEILKAVHGQLFSFVNIKPCHVCPSLFQAECRPEGFIKLPEFIRNDLLVFNHPQQVFNLLQSFRLLQCGLQHFFIKCRHPSRFAAP